MDRHDKRYAGSKRYIAERCRMHGAGHNECGHVYALYVVKSMMNEEDPMYKCWMEFIKAKTTAWLTDNLVLHGEEYTKKLTGDDFYKEYSIDALWDEFIELMAKVSKEIQNKKEV